MGSEPWDRSVSRELGRQDLIGNEVWDRFVSGACDIGEGMGGGGGAGFMTGRATADLLTRTTAILAASFFATSMVLAILANDKSESGSILDQDPAPIAQPTTPSEPNAPVAK